MKCYRCKCRQLDLLSQSNRWLLRMEQNSCKQPMPLLVWVWNTTLVRVKIDTKKWTWVTTSRWPRLDSLQTIWIHKLEHNSTPNTYNRDKQWCSSICILNKVSGTLVEPIINLVISRLAVVSLFRAPILQDQQHKRLKIWLELNRTWKRMGF